MNPSCHEYRESIVESVQDALDEGARVHPETVREDLETVREQRETGREQRETERAHFEKVRAHVERCEGCRAFAESVARQMRALRSLERVAAPATLDGLAVAALHAGHRQQRAADALRDLARPPVPAELDRALWSHGPRRAPLVLERLVDEELADPTKATSQRYTGRLERLRAPEELRRRLARIDGGARHSRRAAWSAALLAFVLLALGTFGALKALRARDVGESLPDVIVERVQSIDDVSPASARVISGLVGGLVDAQRVVREGKL